MFASPLIAAVILIEATAIGGARLPLVLLPALLAAGIGTLVSIGMGSFTGLSSRDYALGPLPLPHFGHPDIAQFGWTIALAIAVAVAVRPIMLGGLFTHRVVVRRIVILLPIVGLIIAGLAIAFHGATGKSVNEVLFSGQEALPGLLRQAGTWSLGALALVIVFKGLAYMLSLGSFRGGPVFPALFLAAAGGIMASRLPGFTLTPAVAVGMGAGDRRGTAAAARGGRARHAAHRQRRNRGRAAHHRRRRRRLPGHPADLRASACRVPGRRWRGRGTDADSGGSPPSRLAAPATDPRRPRPRSENRQLGAMKHTSVDIYLVIDTFLLLLIGIGPKIALVPFVEITAPLDAATKALIVRKMLTTAAVVALILVGLGEFLSRLLHFSTGSLSIAGGIILFIIAITMVRGSAETDGNQAVTERDPMRIAVFPLASRTS